jgi:uroporphyrinogen decarboxylase
MSGEQPGSRGRIHDLVRHRSPGRVPWTLDFGSCKGVHPSVVEAVRRHLAIRGSFARTLDYDIWIAMDPDRLHNDPLPHVGTHLLARVPRTGLQCTVPLSRREGYDYASCFPRLVEGGSLDSTRLHGAEESSFDGFGLYYYPWPGNPEYQSFLSPLEHTDDLARIARFPMPEIHPDDLAAFRDDVQWIRDAGKMSAAWSGSLYELSWYLRGRERILYDYTDNPRVVDAIVEKLANFVEELTLLNLDSGVDVLCFYDDLGTQTSMAISPAVFRRFYKPHYKRIWGAVKSRFPDSFIFLHACGNIREIIPDLVECGLDILNPVQPEAMDVAAIARQFAKDLAFWGSVSVQNTLPRGSALQIEREVRKRIDEVGSRGALILSPANTMGRDVAPQNIAAFVDACRRHCGGAARSSAADSLPAMQ